MIAIDYPEFPPLTRMLNSDINLHHVVHDIFRVFQLISGWICLDVERGSSNKLSL